jgi:hypothetical protein
MQSSHNCLRIIGRGRGVQSYHKISKNAIKNIRLQPKLKPIQRAYKIRINQLTNRQNKRKNG